ncbi:DUF2059 domain-containing protein [Flavobacterium sp. JP2137]|uniref:DUF2059 domain-containing protein n=1 Tax=Flavobacterium sp. JP2137 TaxID=3414510 RepID=UPI003D3011AD
MKKILFSLVFICIAQFSFAQDAAFKSDMLKFMNLSGQMSTFEMLTKDIVDNIPDAKKADFQKELKESLNGLMNSMADMYMTEFTHAEVKDFIKFYESPAGKKLSAKTNVLFEKGQAIGQEWGMGLQGVVMKYME